MTYPNITSAKTASKNYFKINSIKDFEYGTTAYGWNYNKSNKIHDSIFNQKIIHNTGISTFTIRHSSLKKLKGKSISLICGTKNAYDLWMSY